VFKIANKVIENIQQWHPLGHEFAYDLSDRSDSGTAQRPSRSGEQPAVSVLRAGLIYAEQTFQLFCCSFYGCELWDLQASALKDFLRRMVYCAKAHLALAAY
jgi:hypothetical protein